MGFFVGAIKCWRKKAPVKGLDVGRDNLWSVTVPKQNIEYRGIAALTSSVKMVFGLLNSFAHIFVLGGFSWKVFHLVLLRC